MNEQANILFVPLGIYSFQQQLATARYLESHSGFRTNFLLISEADHRFLDQLTAAAIPYSTLEPDRGRNETVVNTSGNFNHEPTRSRVRGGFKPYNWCRHMWIRKQLATRQVRMLGPLCAVVSQERPQAFLPVLRALKDLKITVILMPAADSAPDGSAWPRRDSSSLKAGLNKPSILPEGARWSPFTAILNRVAGRLLPAQVYESQWGNMLFYPAAQAFLLKLMGMLPRNPWYQGTTFANHILISGSDEAALYSEAGVDPGKLLFFGSHELDVLHERWLHRTQLRRRILDDYDMDPNKRVFMLALPRLGVWEENMPSEEAYRQIVDGILDVLSRRDFNVVISIHPAADPGDYTWIKERFPFKICNEPLMEILVAADFFAAEFSSTIRWAVALGLRVINLDLWERNYEPFKTLAGYQTVTSLSEFERSLNTMEITYDPDGLEGGPDPVSPSTGEGDSPAGVLVDGKAKERLLRFIQSLDGETTDAGDVPKQAEAVR